MNLFKKTLLSTAVTTLALTSSVHAQQVINTEGTGQVLMFPFYNLENNSNTFMHISNNTGDNKAIKVRFMEHKNSQVVLEFNAYLGPYDVFPVALDATNAAGASVLTTDSGCTVPELGSSNPPYNGTQTELADGSILRSQPFVPYLYETDAEGTIGRTLLGHAEVIEMGVVSSDIDVSKCSELRTLWSSGAWSTDPSTNVTSPTGGLSGASFFINPNLAYSMSIDVTAVDGWAKAGVNYHKAPGASGPLLSGGSPKATVNGTTYDYTGQANGSVLATSALLASDSIMNEVQIESGLAAQTDWVVTFPTKKYLTNGTTAGAPFTKVYDGTKEANVACESMTLSQFDREAESSTGAGSFVPASSSTGVAGTLCDAVTIISFASSGSAVLANDTTPVGFPFQNGAARLVADQVLPADDNGLVVTGLPVLGFAGTRIVNGPMSYGYTREHVTHASHTVTSGG